MSNFRHLSAVVAIVFFLTSAFCKAQAAAPRPIMGTSYVGSGNGMYAHIADAVAAIPGSGTIILTPGYTDVITSTLRIGHLHGPGMKVMMMPGSTIEEDITDGSAGIKILEGSSLECFGATASGSVNGVLSTCQVVTAGPSVNMASMVTSGALDEGQIQDVFGLQGVTFEAGQARVKAVGDFEGMVTPSLVADNMFFGGPNVTYVWHIGFGTGGGKIFVNNELRGDSSVTGALVYISGGEAGYWIPSSPEIEGGEISCRGSSAQAIMIDGDAGGDGLTGIAGVIFDRVWNQDCPGASPSSPYISIHNADHVTFKDMDFSATGSPILSITESAPGLTNFILFDNVKVICQSLNCSGQTDWIRDTTAGGYTHKLPPRTVNLQHDGFFTYIEHDEAGNWPSGSTYKLASGTATTVTNQTDVSLDVTQSGAAGSTSYQDASQGYAWRVQNQGAINMDFGANDYADSWIESYQSGTTIGKPLNINTKYGGFVNFGGDVFGPDFTFNNGLVTQALTVGSASYADASAGYAWRVRNQGAADLDFGVNGYANSWMESHQEGLPLGKTLNINTKYGGATNFGGAVFAPSYWLANGSNLPAMPAPSAVADYAACIKSAGPPIVLGRCTSGVHSDGSCSCQ